MDTKIEREKVFHPCTEASERRKGNNLDYKKGSLLLLVKENPYSLSAWASPKEIILSFNPRDRNLVLVLKKKKTRRNQFNVLHARDDTTLCDVGRRGPCRTLSISRWFFTFKLRAPRHRWTKFQQWYHCECKHRVDWEHCDLEEL